MSGFTGKGTNEWLHPLSSQGALALHEALSVLTQMLYHCGNSCCSRLEDLCGAQLAGTPSGRQQNILAAVYMMDCTELAL